MSYHGELDGKVTPRCISIAQDLRLIDGKAVPDIGVQMWGKLFGYACNATVTTLTRSRAGVIARSTAGADFVSSVIGEVASVVAAETGTPAPPEVGNIIRGMFAEPNSTYGPSILVDMQEGRTTEGEHTIGDLVDRATRRSIPVPILTAARRNLQAYEINRAASAQSQ